MATFPPMGPLAFEPCFYGLSTSRPKDVPVVCFNPGPITGKFSMADDWYYAQSNERKGPVPFAKLQSMAKSGWLTPDDLVWHAGMTDWTADRKSTRLNSSHEWISRMPSSA